MELYKSCDDMLRHIKSVYEAEKLQEKNSLSHRAIKLALYIFMLMVGMIALCLLYLVCRRNMGL